MSTFIFSTRSLNDRLRTTIHVADEAYQRPGFRLRPPHADTTRFTDHFKHVMFFGGSTSDGPTFIIATFMCIAFTQYRPVDPFASHSHSHSHPRPRLGTAQL